MAAREAMVGSFVLVDSRQRAAVLQALLQALQPEHVLVHRRHAPAASDAYFVVRAAVAAALLRGREGVSVWTALELSAMREAARVDLLDPVPPARPAVVVDGGAPVGVIPGERPELSALRGRGGEGASTPAGEGCWLEAALPASMRLDGRADVTAALRAWSATGEALGVPVDAVIDVVVRAERGLVVEGDPFLHLSLAGARPAEGRVRVRASALGPASARVHAFCGTEYLATVRVSGEVVAGAAAAGASGDRARIEAPPRSPPDLSLLVFEVGGGQRAEVTFTLQSRIEGHAVERFGPVALALEPVAWIQGFLASIDPLAADEAAERRLRLKGAYLAELVLPPLLRERLWRLRDRIETVQILSDERVIPWELCRLSAVEGGRTIEGPFLCEQYAVTRWVFGTAAPSSLSLSRIALVCPRGSGLDQTAAEQRFVMELARPDRSVTVLPGTFLEVTTAMAAGTYDGWHFAGHGLASAADPDQATIALEGGEVLCPEHVSGAVENLGAQRPLVFLNACETGRGAPALVGLGGWASRFLRAGAGAFIGTTWAVPDAAAAAFARSFYCRLTAGEPLGRAVEGARAAIRALGAARLAYTVFGDPSARCPATLPAGEKASLPVVWGAGAASSGRG